MGKGSPKKVESIPLSLLIPVFAAEGMLSVEHANLFTNMRFAKSNPESVNWKEVEEQRIRIYNLTQQYTRAIQNVERYMQNAN